MAARTQCGVCVGPESETALFGIGGLNRSSSSLCAFVKFRESTLPQ
jgi:hypothetical protein